MICKWAEPGDEPRPGQRAGTRALWVRQAGEGAAGCESNSQLVMVGGGGGLRRVWGIRTLHSRAGGRARRAGQQDGHEWVAAGEQDVSSMEQDVSSMGSREQLDQAILSLL